MPRKNKDSAPQVHVVETEYGHVLLNEATGAYLHLNETAAFIKQHLDAGEEPDAVADRLAEEYAVDRSTAGRDVEAFCRTLAERGLR